MKRGKTFTIALALGVVLMPLTAHGQQAGKLRRIGFLGSFPPSAASSHLVDAFRGGLRDLGYVEGQNISIEVRSTEGKSERLPELAAELVGLRVDVIVANGTPGPLALKRATTTVPIVMTSAGDLVGSGLVASLARPGGNVTGLSLLVPELGGKRLQLLKEIVPELSRVAVLWNSANPYASLVVREIEVAARTLGVQLQSLEVRSANDFASAFGAAVKGRAGALIAVDDPLTVGYRTRIVELAAKSRLPAAYGFREFVDEGGFMSYGAHLPDLYRRAATYVDKILKGAQPADLPVEQPTRFELLINAKTAKALGLAVPPSVLLRADQLIE